MQTKNRRIGTYYFDTFGRLTWCGSKIANKLSTSGFKLLKSNVFIEHLLQQMNC